MAAATTFSDREDTTTPEPVNLGQAAQQATQTLMEGEGVQDVLDETEYTKVKFVGMAFDDLESNIQIGDMRTFVVRARCVGETKEAMASGGVREVRKMKVEGVELSAGPQG